MARRFVVGDRVRRKPPPMGPTKIVVGTIQTVYLSGDFYDILFDGTTELRMLRGDEIELVAPHEDAEPGSAPGRG